MKARFRFISPNADHSFVTDMIASEPTVDDFPALQMVRTGRIVRIVGRITFVTLVISIIAMVFVPWRQTARGTGIVLALDPQQRPQPMLSQSKGVVSYVKPGLREGSYVEEGELLLQMTPFAADGVAQMDTQIIALESKLQAEKASLEVAKTSGIAISIRRVDGEVAAAGVQGGPAEVGAGQERSHRPCGLNCVTN